VVRNVRHYEVRSPSRIQAYVPMRQSLRNWGTSLFIAVRTTAGADEFGGRLRSIVQDIDRNAPVGEVRSLDSYIGDDLAEERALGGLLSAFGLLALGLAGVGVFGVMSLLVGARLPEIGVRLAMGALPMQVLRMVVGRTLLLAGAGTAIGLLAAGGLSGLMRAFLYETGPLDARVYAGSAAFLLVVAACAALAPALRAARVDPVSILRRET
jgi:ABC-type antimicrobial peptide transport system permease subunit